MFKPPNKQNAYHGEIDEFISRRYRVLARLSKGGTSEIYRAVDTANNSKVVIKILLSDYADIAKPEEEKASEFIVQEARFLETCHHPNIIRLHDYNLDVRRPYIILDRLENRTLDKLILRRKNPFSIQETLNIAEQICAALSYIQDKGFVYCDLKPNNIIYYRKKLTLIDFGFVRPIHMLINGGSIGYMAPEILEGGPSEARAMPTLDIYSLGILMYELLTKLHPISNQFNQPTFDGSSPKLASELNPALPKVFDAILLRCIEKRPSDRYQDANSFWVEFSRAASRFI